MNDPRCYIDGCGQPATLVRASYPDDVLLCDDHAWLDGESDKWENYRDERW